MTGVEYRHEGQTTVVHIDGEYHGTYANLDHARRAVHYALMESTRIAAKNISTGIVHPD